MLMLVGVRCWLLGGWYPLVFLAVGRLAARRAVPKKANLEQTAATLNFDFYAVSFVGTIQVI